MNSRRGERPANVFTHRGKPVQRILIGSCRRVRKAFGLPQARVHDLKHTFGRRLRTAGVSFKVQQDLLGHRSGRMTTHYSAAELTRLIWAANTVCERKGNRPELVVLRRISVS
ncbi:MAG: tyrosine-type recombinase/integrase [Pseudomonadota bacterium]